jgi:hypothetical protein
LQGWIVQWSDAQRARWLLDDRVAIRADTSKFGIKVGRDYSKDGCMVHFVGRLHCVDREILGRVNSVIMLGLVGTGLAACVFGAAVYDVGRLFSAW